LCRVIKLQDPCKLHELWHKVISWLVEYFIEINLVLLSAGQSKPNLEKRVSSIRKVSTLIVLFYLTEKVMQIKATDADIGKNAQLKFGLVSGTVRRWFADGSRDESKPPERMMFLLWSF